MNVIPLNLWKTIMELSEPYEQSLEYPHNNLSFDNNNLNFIRVKIEDYMMENGVSHNDLIRHIIRQNDYSVSKLTEFIDGIRKDKDTCEYDCAGHVLDRAEPDLNDDDNSMICTLCNAEYPCQECYDVYKNNKEMIDNGLTNICDRIVIDCESCEEPVKAYVCAHCHQIKFKCHCHDIEP